MCTVTGLYSASISLTFVPKNRYVQSGKIIYLHTVRLQITTIRLYEMLEGFKVETADTESGDTNKANGALAAA